MHNRERNINIFGNPKVLIFGYGFLGKYLAKYLVNYGYDLAVLTRSSINEKIRDPRIKYFTALNNFFDSAKTFEPEIVINAAGSGSPSRYEINTKLAETEIHGVTSELIEFWKEFKFNLIFFSSGGTVYGPNYSEPIDESAYLNPVSNYGKLKMIQEKMFLESGEQNSSNLLILRISNVYHLGDPMRKSHGFLETCLKNLLKNEPIKIYGSKEITRDFIYIEDFLHVVKGLIEKKVMGEIVNVGTSFGSTLTQIVEYINMHSKKSLKIERFPEIEEKIYFNVLDNSKLLSYLDFEFSTVEKKLFEFFSNSQSL